MPWATKRTRAAGDRSELPLTGEFRPATQATFPGRRLLLRAAFQHISQSINMRNN